MQRFVVDSDNMDVGDAQRNPYLIKSVVHASKLMAAFQSPGEVLRLCDLVERTALSRGIVFRLLYTFEQCGVVNKVGVNQYRLAVHLGGRHRWKIGYAALGNEDPFVREVSNGLRFAAEQNEEVELFVLDNRFSVAVAARNVDHLVREHVNLAVEYQRDDRIAAMIASKFHAAGIPFIAINNPHPGATYFGVDNYAAGLAGGRFLARAAQERWDGAVDEIVLIDLNRAGAVPRSRLLGTVDGIADVLGNRSEGIRIVHLDGDGDRERSWQAARAHLRNGNPGKTLLSGVNDTSVLGAIRAYEEAGRARDCLAMGQNGSPEARAELRSGSNVFIGSVAYFPERYGEALMRLALDILNRRFAPPSIFTKHQILTPKNVERVYPGDTLSM
jgi:ribose transport system substrate-binding protein